MRLKKILEIPVMSEGKNKRQLNNAQLVNLLKDNIKDFNDASVVVEQVNAMPKRVTSMSNFGQTFGAIKGICAALGSIYFVEASKNGKNTLI